MMIKGNNKNLPNLDKNTNIHIEEIKRSTVRFNSTKPTPSLLVIKFLKVTTKRIFSRVQEKRNKYMQLVSISLIADFSA
jgi:hypothetical protein